MPFYFSSESRHFEATQLFFILRKLLSMTYYCSPILPYFLVSCTPRMFTFWSLGVRNRKKIESLYIDSVPTSELLYYFSYSKSAFKQEST
jgi:hypothetical protein